VPLRCASAVAYYQQAAKMVVDGWEGNPLVERRPQYLFEGPADPNKQIDETVVQYYQSEAAGQSERTGQGGGRLEAALGRLHYHGTSHLRQDFEKAAVFFKAAVDQVNIRGQLRPSLSLFKYSQILPRSTAGRNFSAEWDGLSPHAGPRGREKLLDGFGLFQAWE
jgi:TPR repeat protein